MSRLPFDPKKIADPAEDDIRPARRERRRYGNLADARELTVSQVSELIKTTLEQRIASPLRVIGEVSNLSARGHWYFSLKDDQSVIGCVAWASSARKFGFTPEDGQEVVATGHLSHYAPQGRTQLYVRKLEPVGAGALDLAFRKLCEELRKLGYFDDSRKKPLPAFPNRVAVITSAGGAALHDVINTAAQRCCAVSLLIVDVKVQGDGAGQMIASAVQRIDQQRHALGIDAMLITRGGGSLEDLWAFNERCVADAVYNCTLPVVAAIGHESDTTIVELVADKRASTPTQAAMLLVPDQRELLQQVRHLDDRLRVVMRRVIDHNSRRLDLIIRHEMFRNPLRALRQVCERFEVLQRDVERALRNRLLRERNRFEQLCSRMGALQPPVIIGRKHEQVAVYEDRLDRSLRYRCRAARPVIAQHADRLHTATLRMIRQRRHHVDALQRALAAVDPENVLQRGFSLTRDADGRLIRSTRAVAPGQLIRTVVTDGEIASTVNAVEPDGGSTTAEGKNPAETRTTSTKAKSQRNPQSTKNEDGRQQMDLFDRGG